MLAARWRRRAPGGLQRRHLSWRRLLRGRRGIPEAAGIDDVGRGLRLAGRRLVSHGRGLRLGRCNELRIGRSELDRSGDLRLGARCRHRIGRLGRGGNHGRRNRLRGRGGRALVILVAARGGGSRLALEQGGKEIRLAAGIFAGAAALDVGLGQLIALQRRAVGRNVDGAAVREHAGELVMRHARPVPDAAGVQMHEGRAGGRIEADAAALQAQAGEADLLQRHARNVEVHRMPQHVLAEARHAGGAAAEHRVGGGRAVGGDDLDRLLAVDVAIDFPEDVEQATVHDRLVLVPPVAQEVVELLQRGLVEAASRLKVTVRSSPEWVWWNESVLVLFSAAASWTEPAAASSSRKRGRSGIRPSLPHGTTTALRICVRNLSARRAHPVDERSKWTLPQPR